jgi:hypothetical protein
MFSSQMSPDSVYNLILGKYSYGENLGPDIIPATSRKGTNILVED